MSVETFIKELVKQQVSDKLEMKINWDTDSILKSVCAFLNTDGGWIIVGFDGEKYLGVSDISEHSVNELKKRASDEIFPQALIYIQEELIKGKKIILLNVLRGSRQPYSFKKKYYIHSKNKTKEASPDDISLILRASNQYTSSWEKTSTIDAIYSDLDETGIIKTIESAKLLGKANTLPETHREFLSYFQLVDYSIIRNGAIILYGFNPTRFFSQCRIRITNMPNGVIGNHYTDIELIEDNLFTSFDRVMNYFKKNIPVISTFDQDNPIRIDRPKYPFEALDEAIVNALVHRDYGDLSGEVTINIYEDKIEIINSGEIPSNIISKKNTIETHHSVLRNPTIAHMFFLMGRMEKLGRGLSLIKNKFEEFKLKSPEWVFQNGYTMLTLFCVPNEVKVNNRIFRFFSQMEYEKIYSREDYISFFRDCEILKERTARSDIQKLTEGGWLRKVGDGPQTGYVKTSKKMPDIAG